MLNHFRLSRSGRSFGWILLTMLPLAMLALAWPASADSPGTTKIKRLGNRATTFSAKPAKTLADLQSQAEHYRADFQSVLQQTGWGGDPNDLFAAIAAGKVEAVDVPVGATMQWMAYRKKGQPTFKPNVEWAGKKPFPAWQVNFESKGYRYTFVLPKACLNLALIHQEMLPPPPPPPTVSCSLSATVGTSKCGPLPSITVNGTSDGQLAITAIQQDGSAQDPSKAKAEGAARWTYMPSAPGSYTFTATATKPGAVPKTCMAPATVPVVPPCVACALTGSYDPATRSFALDSSGSIGTVNVTVSHPDGKAGDPSRLTAAGPNRWTYAPKRVKTGDYTFKARAENEGATKDCTDVTLNVPPPDSRWVFRLFGARPDPASDSSYTSVFRPNGVNERSDLRLDAGIGFGLGLEYLASRRVGVELSAIFADLDSQLMFDLDELWETDTADLGITMITLGLNYHLTPDRRVDFFVGPLIGLVQYDSASYRVLGETVRHNFGDDDFTWGLNFGLDFPFKPDSRWGLTAGLRYLDSSADEGDDDDNATGQERSLDVNPLTLMAGIAYRF